MVVGVHSPEFNFEKNHDNVKAAVTRLHVDYPVALDDDMAIWNQFANNYWPADYIADRQGHLRDMTVGEGELHADRGRAAQATRCRVGARRGRAPATRATSGKPRPRARDVTPETYLGLERGTEGAESGENQYPDAEPSARDKPALVGKWYGDTQNVTSTEAAPPSSSSTAPAR